jgi:hypothetical protein
MSYNYLYYIKIYPCPLSVFEDIVILEAFINKRVAEELVEVRITRLVIKAEGASIVY